MQVVAGVKSVLVDTRFEIVSPTVFLLVIVNGF